MRIDTYIINLEHRSDRRIHVLREFEKRNEFNAILTKAHEDKNGSLGLWKTITSIVSEAIYNQVEFIIICEDDHVFTTDYSRENLLEQIEFAKSQNADILLGGISWFQNMIRVSETFYWVEKFSGMQFAIIFKNFFETILHTDFGPKDSSDYKISSLSTNKFFLHPFISIQKEFGYSDVTERNAPFGRVSALFEHSAQAVRHLNNLNKSYLLCSNERKKHLRHFDQKRASLPLFTIIYGPLYQVSQIQNELIGKPEFCVSWIDGTGKIDDELWLWDQIKNITENALKNDDDFFILCDQTHVFTPEYSKLLLMKQIEESLLYGVEILSGGTMNLFNHSIPLSKSILWIDQIVSGQFLVIFKPLYKQILSTSIDKEMGAIVTLSEIASHKMISFPFISKRKYVKNDEHLSKFDFAGVIAKSFDDAMKRLVLINSKKESYK